MPMLALLACQDTALNTGDTSSTTLGSTSSSSTAECVDSKQYHCGTSEETNHVDSIYPPSSSSVAVCVDNKQYQCTTPADTIDVDSIYPPTLQNYDSVAIDSIRIYNADGYMSMLSLNPFETLFLQTGSRIEISLPTNVSTGYSWLVTTSSELLKQSQYTLCPGATSGMVGEPCVEVIRFDVLAEGRSDIEIIYSRSWLGEPLSYSHFSIQTR